MSNSERGVSGYESAAVIPTCCIALAFFGCMWEVKTASRGWICEDESLRSPQLITTEFSPNLEETHARAGPKAHTQAAMPSSSKAVQGSDLMLFIWCVITVIPGRFNLFIYRTIKIVENLDPDPPNKH